MQPSSWASFYYRLVLRDIKQNKLKEMRSTPVLPPPYFSNATRNFCMVPCKGRREGAAHQWEPQRSSLVHGHLATSVPASPLPPLSPGGKELISRRGCAVCPQCCKSKQSSIPKRHQISARLSLWSYLCLLWLPPLPNAPRRSPKFLLQL